MISNIDIVILASGRSKRFKHSVPSATLRNSSKLNSLIDGKSVTVLSRLVRQFSKLGKVNLVCNPEIDSFSYLDNNDYDFTRIRVDSSNHDNCYSLHQYFKSITNYPTTLIILDADTCIPDNTFDALSTAITKLSTNDCDSKYNYIVSVDKTRSNKSDSEWCIKPSNNHYYIKYIDNNSKSSKYRVTSGITIFNNFNSIQKLFKFTQKESNYDNYWDYMYYNDININKSKIYIELKLGPIYEIDNYNDYLLIRNKYDLGEFTND